jgi:ribosomal protein L34
MIVFVGVFAKEKTYQPKPGVIKKHGFRSRIEIYYWRSVLKRRR